MLRLRERSPDVTERGVGIAEGETAEIVQAWIKSFPIGRVACESVIFSDIFQETRNALRITARHGEEITSDLRAAFAACTYSVRLISYSSYVFWRGA